MVELILAVLIVVGASAICSGTEAALFSVSIIKVRHKAEEGNSTAKLLLDIRENMGRPIGAIVVFNNIANITGSFMVGIIAIKVIGGELWEPWGLAVFTFLVILFAEIVPKNLGEQYSDQVAMIMARPVWFFAMILTPILWLLEKLTAPLSNDAASYSTNEAEIRLLASMGQKEGIIENDEGEMIQRVFELNDLTAGDILTPRVVMTWLPSEDTLEAAKATILESTHSRLIVADKEIDDIKGFALKAELLRGLIEGQGHRPISEFVKEVRFVPKQIKADALLLSFRATRQHLAVVLDEFGGVVGVVTLEDVLEVLTGEIMDETDAWENLQDVARQKLRQRRVLQAKKRKAQSD